jgi:hypothetical protein
LNRIFKLEKKEGRREVNMEKMFKEFSKVKVQLKSLSDPGEIVELESEKEFDTEEEIEEFVKVIMGILSPVKDQNKYDVHVEYKTKETSGEVPSTEEEED